MSVSPISKCTDDVLLKIFSIGGDIYRDRRPFAKRAHKTSPISITRRSSQVCKGWRQLILGSPSLWGKLLDLNDLNTGSDRWRKEVLSRVKQAMLHVKVDLEPSQPAAMALLFDILHEKWPTIRNLEVSILRRGDYDDKRWLAIHRPTENLRSITLDFLRDVPEPLRSTHNVLFSGRAPSLKFVTIRHMNFQLPAQWFPQLYTFQRLGQCRTSQLMESMSSMPFLEYLELFELGSDDAEFGRTISLPRLKLLVISGQFAACLRVLSHLTVSPGCGLEIDWSNHREDTITDADLFAASQVLTQYCKSYFKVHIPTSIKMSIRWTFFDFCNIFEDINIPSFNLRVVNSNGFSSMDPFFKAFLDCPFSKVTKLFFESDPNVTFCSANPIFSNFLSLFSTLDSLTGRPANLQTVVDIAAYNDSIPFPALKSIRIFHLTDESLPQIIGFLNWRQAVSAPIQILSLDYRPRLLRLNFSALEQYSGLKVRCQTPGGLELLEYICGSGTPEQINFRHEEN
ncbi:hypothetical protein M413DRAFT_410679 [Hebeloma cylindrosporum]|uniref:Uncharacterized protein n=1 Tax=Hebeloma cylindrosporum TaxID=76867 RepID=A0A0C2XWP5_HEBCY|nr:hypothetical protein M413DRAFT_410679 [Hebeloma cylindrosporum h7]